MKHTDPTPEPVASIHTSAGVPGEAQSLVGDERTVGQKVAKEQIAFLKNWFGEKVQFADTELQQIEAVFVELLDKELSASGEVPEPTQRKCWFKGAATAPRDGT